MAAALGEILILELDGVGAGAFEQAHRTLDVERIAITGVGVDHEMSADPVADQADGIDHLAQADEADVGPAEPRIGDGRARDVHRLEAGLLGDQRGQRIVDARRDQDGRTRQARAQGVLGHMLKSQIRAFEFRIGADCGGRAGHDELPFGEDVGAVGDFQALHHVLLDQ